MVSAANTRQELYRGILALHTALRKCAIRVQDVPLGPQHVVRAHECLLCHRTWQRSEEEKHGTDCLASPTADLIKAHDDASG